MLTRRLIPRNPTLLRSFSTTPTTANTKTPSLSEITPDHGEEFQARVKDFRSKTPQYPSHKLESALKSRGVSSSFRSARASDSVPAAVQSSGAFSSTSPSISYDQASSPSAAEQAGERSSYASDLAPSSSRSRATSSTASTATQTPEEDADPSKRKKGPLQSLFYGTQAGRQMETEIEQSYSKVLARGKYVHSIVFHQVKPEKVDEYVALVGDYYPKIAADPENKVHLVGSWRSEVGTGDTFGTVFSFSKTPIDVNWQL